MAGYSGSPLSKKLGIKEGAKVLLVGPPSGYQKLLDPLPEDVSFVSRLTAATDLIQIFTTKRSELAKALSSYRKSMRADATIWVSWPKKTAAKAANISTDITEDTVREVALPLGLVDVKVCAVDDVWSGLKLVIRRELR
jgi:hypothetical protein